MASRQMRSVNRTVVRPGGAGVAQLVDKTTEDLFVTVDGTAYPVYIFGQGDPDETNPDGTSRYYIP